MRAPLPTKVERLYGATTDPRMLAAASAAQYGLNQQRHTAPPVSPGPGLEVAHMHHQRHKICEISSLRSSPYQCYSKIDINLDMI